jgi:ABC-type oligopeptide transport system substrate-binding subunit
VSKFHLTRLAGILCLLVVFLAACSNAGQSSNSTGNLPAAPPDKQVIRAPVEDGDFDSLDPALTSGGLGDPFNLIYAGLVTAKADGTPVDHLAASHQVSSDGLTWTFTLKDNLKFSDGTPITAEDVAYSLNRVVLPATKSSVSNYLSLLKDYDKVTAGKIPTLINDSIIVKDPKTIVLILSKPASYFLETLTYSTGDVVERKLVEKYGEKWIDHLAEGGASGPFKVQSYGHTSSLVLVPNPNYYSFKPKIQKIVYTLAADRDSNYKAFKAGQYDYSPVPPSQDDYARSKPGFQQVPALASRYIGLNYLAKPFDNIKIRQAFALAINRDLIVGRIVGKNVVTPSNHIVPKGMPGYNEKLTGPAGVASTAGDQTKAKQLFQEGLQEAGYGSVSKLPPLTLAYYIAYKAGADTMAAVAAEWKQVLGVDVKLVGLQSTDLVKQEFSTVGNSGPLQMWYGSWAADYPDPQDWLSTFFGKGTTHNSFNYGQNQSSTAAAQQAVQEKLAQADGEQDQAKRMQLYNEAEEQIVNEAAWITTYQSSYSYSVNPKLRNWTLNSMGVVPVEDWANIYFTQ